MRHNTNIHEPYFLGIERQEQVSLLNNGSLLIVGDKQNGKEKKRKQQQQNQVGDNGA